MKTMHGNLFTRCGFSYGCVLAFGLGLNISILAATVQTQTRERFSFNSNWRFIQDDPADTGNKLNYTNIKAWVVATGSEFTTNLTAAIAPEGIPGNDVAYAQLNYDDTTWRQ